MENFIKDFKIYCEEVEDIKGLQIIKNNIFSYYLNLELIEEYVVDEGYNFEEQIRSAKMTIYNIDKAIKKAEKVANTEYRQLYKLLYGLGKEDIKIASKGSEMYVKLAKELIKNNKKWGK